MTQRIVRAGWMAVFGAVLAVPVAVRLATSGPLPLWSQLADITGLLALSGLVCAAVLPSRVRSLTRAFGIEDILDVHRFLGIASAMLVLLHLACVVAMNPAQVALLDPALNGPPAKAASVATAALVMLVVLAAARRRLEQRYEVWRWIHVLLAITTLAGSALHVLWLNHLINEPALYTIFMLLAVAVTGVLAHRWMWRTLLDPSTEFVVAQVRRESPTVTTVSLAARNGCSDDSWDFATRPVRLAAADPFGHRRGAPVHHRLVAAPAGPRRVHHPQRGRLHPRHQPAQARPAGLGRRPARVVHQRRLLGRGCRHDRRRGRHHPDDEHGARGGRPP